MRGVGSESGCHLRVLGFWTLRVEGFRGVALNPRRSGFSFEGLKGSGLRDWSLGFGGWQC